MAETGAVKLITLSQLAARYSRETGCIITHCRIWKRLQRHPEWQVPIHYLRGLGGRPAACVPEDQADRIKLLLNL
jgi:hypothetical protein